MRNIDSAHIFHSQRARTAAWAAALILGSFLGMASPAQAQASSAPWKLVDSEATMPALGEGHSGIVFMKLADADPQADAFPGKGSTVSVFVDGTYHASLPKASWAYAEICPGAHVLSAGQDKAILSITEDQPGGQRYEFAAATVSYFQLRQDGQGMPQLQAVEAGAARAAVEQLPKAVHTISRLQAKDCSQANAVPLPVQTTPVAAVTPAHKVTNYTLRSSTYFDFDDARMGLKHGRGLTELDDIVKKVHESYAVVQHIDVIGYADPTGTAAYNLNLSRKRAGTVASYLTQVGFAPSILTTKGMGATNLAVPDCATWLKTPQQIHACNEPNRRVELVVHGSPKN